MTTLLDACLLHSGRTGGTIHEYLPRVAIGKGKRCGDAIYRPVMLDGVEIGKHCQGDGCPKPVVNPHLSLAIVYPRSTPPPQYYAQDYDQIPTQHQSMPVDEQM